MASIIPFIPTAAFDDETTRIMGEAFDAACQALKGKGQPSVIQEIIARRIIASARKGERDPDRLRDAGVATMRFES
jgi:hypothetical protein